MTRTNNTPRSGWFWQHKIFSLIILLSLVVAVYIIYDRIQTVNNRRDFQHAHTAIDSIYTDVVHNVGAPDNSEESNSCARSHEEFSSGDLTCYLNKHFIYSVNSEMQADSIFKKIQFTISKVISFKPKGNLSASIIDSHTPTYTIHAASDAYQSYNLSCTINYIYDTPREIDLKIKDQTKKPFEITIGCYGPAKQQYYHLES